MAIYNGVYYSNSTGLNLRTNATTRINISTGGVITFNEDYSFPTADGGANEVLLTNGTGTLSFSTIPNASLVNSSITINGSSISLGGSITVGDITTVTAGDGLTGGGTTGAVTLNVGGGTGILVAADTVSIDYAGTDNFIDSATNLEGTGISLSDTIVYHDATDNNVKKGFVSDLPFSNTSGTVTSVSISGSDGIDIDSGSPITSSGTIALGLSNVPNSSLANSSITINGSSISLGGSITVGDITGVTAGTGLSGGGTTGSVTLGVDYTGIDNIILSSTDASTSTMSTGDFIMFSDGSTNVVSYAYVGDLPFTNNTGDITGITAGTGISGGGTSGNVTITNSAPNVSTNLTTSTAATTLTVNSSDGTNAVLPAATTTVAGVMTGVDKTKLDGIASGANNYVLPAATATSLGGIELFSATAQTIAANAVSATASRTYGLQVNTAGQGVINVPWTDTGYVLPAATATSLGGIELFSATAQTIAANAVSATASRTYGLQVNPDGQGVINVPWTDANTTYTAGSGLSLTGTVFANTAPNIVQTTVSGNAGSATVLQTARTIAGVSFNGSADISLNNNAITNGAGYTTNIGDITTVTAGNGLTGGGTTGAVTLNVGAGTGITVAADTVSIDYLGTDNFIKSATNSTSTAIDNDDFIVYSDGATGNVHYGYVNDLPFTNSSGSVTSVAISGSDGIDVDSGSPITGSGTIALGLSNIPNSSLANSSITINGSATSLGGSITVGDITEVTAGNGLTGGGTTGAVTLNVGAGTGISVAADTVSIDYAGTDNFIDSATNLEGTAITTSDTIVYHDATDNNVKKGFVSDLPFSNNSGTVTSVGITAGTLIDVTGGPITSSGNITVNVDLSELATSTTNGDGDFFAVVDSVNAQKKLTKGNINLSGFDDDITIYNTDGTLSATRMLTQNNNTLSFAANGTETFSVYKGVGTTVGTPRVFLEADAVYTDVLELLTTGPTTNLVTGYDPGQAPVFTVDAFGNLSATSKAFDIPHPNPEKKAQGMRLKHGNLEGPEHGIYVRGRQLNDKEIELPVYWLDLVDSDTITVQLTSVGSHQNLYVKEIKDNVVYIGNGNLFSNKIDCYYFIQAERKDINKIDVEYQK